MIWAALLLLTCTGLKAEILTRETDTDNSEVVINAGITKEGTPSFLWYIDGRPLTDAPLPYASRLVVYPTHEPRARYCKVAVSYPAGDIVWSEAFPLIEEDAPVLISEPSSTMASKGDTITISTYAVSSSALSYEWRKSGVPVSTSPTLMIASAQPSDSDWYEAVVRNAYGSVTSQPFQLTVTQTFSAWAADQGLEGSHANQLEDTDRDGASNLMEYALGLSPTTPNQTPPLTTTAEAGYIVFRFNRPKSSVGISYDLQTTTDLINWISLGAPAVESATATIESMVARFPLNERHRFVRLSVRSL